MTHSEMKIYDCFMFFNEVDLLEIRLNYLNDSVDYFILVESNKTHSGLNKPYYFEEHKDRFKEFHHKIIHIKISPNTEGMKFEKAKDYVNFSNNDYWKLENAQRNSISEGLINCTNEDVIIIGDVDEIPSKEGILIFINNRHLKILSFIQKNHMYYFNYVVQSPFNDWYGSVILNFNELISPQTIRDKRKEYLGFNSGWHFSFLGGIDKIITKIRSFAHSEYDNETVLNRDNIINCINLGEDVLGQIYENQSITLNAINLTDFKDTYPDYLINNLDKFSNYLFKANKE
jgi:beta-1,4-mannosyl-glycoprotein beta-1,4-N-acetylglucosaminyltransferase